MDFKQKENGKIELSVGKLSIELDWLFIMLMDVAAKVGDQVIVGENLSADQKRLVQWLDATGKIWGESAVENTETELDDEALEKVLDLFEDTAKEGGFFLLQFEE